MTSILHVLKPGAGATLFPVAAVVAIALVSAGPAAATSAQVTFALGPAGVALQNDTVLIATRLKNTSDQNAFSVQIESISLSSAALIAPTTFPVPVGEIDAGQNAIIQASFNRSGLLQGVQFQLTVHGSYRPVNKGTKDDEGHEFTVTTGVILPPTSPGSATVRSNTLPSNEVSGGGFPPVTVPGDNEIDESPPVPTGPVVPITPTPNSTIVKPDPSDPPVTFNANDPLNLTSGGSNGQVSNTGTIANGGVEPSGASNGAGVIFATANWVAAFSTDGGSSFTQLDPTTIFNAKDAIGFCCDQIVQYVPSIDRFIWLLQGGGGYRLALASPSDVKASKGTKWTQWNGFTPAFFGLKGSLDYPDMSVGSNYLYLSFDQTGTGLMVVRISLAQLQAGGTITVEWTDPKNGGAAYGGHVMQNTGGEVFWAGHNGITQLRVFSWAEGTGTYFWRDVTIGSWSGTGISSTTPDNVDWLTKLSGFPGTGVIGATRAFGPPTKPFEVFSDGLWFAWSAGTDSNFKQQHTEMVTLDRSNNFALAQQVQIWNNSFAFAYPALATNTCTGEVGLSFMYGGGGNYENHVVGFWGDFIAYVTTNSSVGAVRNGDYVTIRQDPTPGLRGEFFDAFGYGRNKPSAGQTGTQTDVRYVQFGRGGFCHID
jgi:hypothetical protein